MVSLTKKYELLQEGLFELDRNVWKEVYDYVYESYKKFASSNRAKITKNFIPPKIFNLDFTGTRFEKLNFLKPKIKIFFFYERGGCWGYFWVYDKELDRYTILEHGNIYINLSVNLENLLGETLEHEILHYIQRLIGIYFKKIKGKSYNLEKDYDDIGGLPPKKITPKKYTSSGYIKNSSNQKRVEHHMRPIEYYTNLNSALRFLQLQYQIFLDIHSGHKKIKDDLKTRQVFFYNRLQDSLTKKSYNRFSRVIKDIYNFDKKIFKRFLKLIYKAFVNNESKIDMLDVLEKSDLK